MKVETYHSRCWRGYTSSENKNLYCYITIFTLRPCLFRLGAGFSVPSFRYYTAVSNKPYPHIYKTCCSSSDVSIKTVSAHSCLYKRPALYEPVCTLMKILLMDFSIFSWIFVQPCPKKKKKKKIPANSMPDMMLISQLPSRCVCLTLQPLTWNKIKFLKITAISQKYVAYFQTKIINLKPEFQDGCSLPDFLTAVNLSSVNL